MGNSINNRSSYKIKISSDKGDFYIDSFAFIDIPKNTTINSICGYKDMSSFPGCILSTKMLGIGDDSIRKFVLYKLQSYRTYLPIFISGKTDTTVLDGGIYYVMLVSENDINKINLII